MKTRFKLALLGVSAIIPLSVFAGVGLADPSDLFVAQVPPHRHFIATPNGKLVAVGPQICERPSLEQAFLQFHHNVHHSFVPGFGTVHTLGPQDGAPGLHPSNTEGARDHRAALQLPESVVGGQGRAGVLRPRRPSTFREDP